MTDKMENPEKKPGESQSDFVSRCIPIVKNEHPDWDDDRVAAACYGMYRQKMLENGYQSFTDSAEFITVNETEEQELENGDIETSTNTRRIVAIVGDRWMNGGWLSKEELKKVYKQWEGTLHDINHEGTSSGVFGQRQDITKFVGYHTNANYDETNHSVSMDLTINKETMYANAWEAFIKLCEQAGRIPNVSVTYYGKQKFVKASELPETALENANVSPDDMVPVLYNVVPVCVSTVLQGKCSDKGGCGVRNTDSTCGSDSDSCDCEKPKDTKLDEEIEKKRQELITWLKEN